MAPFYFHSYLHTLIFLDHNYLVSHTSWTILLHPQCKNKNTCCCKFFSTNTKSMDSSFYSFLWTVMASIKVRLLNYQNGWEIMYDVSINDNFICYVLLLLFLYGLDFIFLRSKNQLQGLKSYRSWKITKTISSILPKEQNFFKMMNKVKTEKVN